MLQEWTAEKGEELKESYYANLREQYDILTEAPAVGDEAASASAPSRELAVAPGQTR